MSAKRKISAIALGPPPDSKKFKNEPMKMNFTNESPGAMDEKSFITIKPALNYTYTNENLQVKIHIYIENIHQTYHSIEALFKSLEFSLEARDIRGKNYEMKIVKLAHKIIPNECSFALIEDKVVVVLVKKEPLIQWKSLSESEESKSAECRFHFHTFVETLPSRLLSNGDNLLSSCELLQPDLRHRSEEYKSLYQSINAASSESELNHLISECKTKIHAGFDAEIAELLMICYHRLYKFDRSSTRQLKEHFEFSLSREKLSADPNQLLEKAGDLFESGDFKGALQSFQEAKEGGALEVALDAQIAHCHLLIDQNCEALAISDRLLRNSPENPNGIFIKGLEAYYENRKDEACDHFETCLDIDQNHQLAQAFYKELRDIYFFKDRGNKFFNSKKDQLATNAYKKGLQVMSRNKKLRSVLYQNLAAAQYKLDLIEEAIVSLNTAIKLNPNYLKALHKRAEIFTSLKEFEKAMKDYETICQLAPEPANLKLLKNAREKVLSGDHEAKSKALRESAKKLHSAKNFRKACEEYSAAIALTPREAVLYFNRAACFMMMDELAMALKDAKKSVELDNIIKYQLRKAKIELCLGLFYDALSSFESIRKLDKENVDAELGVAEVNYYKVLLKKGKIDLRNKKYEEALKCYWKVCEVAKNSTDLFLDKLELMLLNDQYKEVNKLFSVKKKDSLEFLFGLTLHAYFCLDFQPLFETLCKLNHSKFAKHPKVVQLDNLITKMDECFSDIKRLFTKKKYKSCVSIAHAGLDIDRRNKVLLGSLRVKIGICLSQLGDFKEAIPQVTKAIEVLSSIKGRDHSQMEELKVALQCRFECFREINSHQEALEDLEKRISFGPNPYLLRERGNLRAIIEQNKRKGATGYYAILGVSPDATSDAIQNAYERLSVKYHLDQCFTPEAKVEGEKKIKMISEAFNILSDPLKKLRYDRADDICEDVDPSPEADIMFVFGEFMS